VRQTVDKPRTDRIADPHEYNWHRAGHLLHSQNARGRRGQDDIRRERKQLVGIFAKAINIARGPAGIDPHVAAIAPAQLLQPLHECDESALPFRIVRGQIHQHSNPPHPLALLRARRERPGGHATTQKRDELAAPHTASPPGETPDELRLSHWGAMSVVHHSKFGGQCRSWISRTVSAMSAVSLLNLQLPTADGPAKIGALRQ
jgi:hypothetical protein